MTISFSLHKFVKLDEQGAKGEKEREGVGGDWYRLWPLNTQPGSTHQISEIPTRDNRLYHTILNT